MRSRRTRLVPRGSSFVCWMSEMTVEMDALVICLLVHSSGRDNEVGQLPECEFEVLLSARRRDRGRRQGRPCEHHDREP